MSDSFEWPVRVYWEDTDAGGVVYHATYLHFLERCRTEWLRRLGVHQTAMRETDGALLVVTSIQCDYRQSARLDDELLVRATVRESGKASFVFLQTIDCEGKRLVDASVKVACLDADRWRPRRFPEHLSATLRALGTSD